jgi:hypothetical protein
LRHAHAALDRPGIGAGGLAKGFGQRRIRSESEIDLPVLLRVQTEVLAQPSDDVGHLGVAECRKPLLRQVFTSVREAIGNFTGYRDFSTSKERHRRSVAAVLAC